MHSELAGMSDVSAPLEQRQYSFRSTSRDFSFERDRCFLDNDLRLDRDEISWRCLLFYGCDVAKFVVFKYLFRFFLRERIYFYILERLKFFLHVLCYVRRFF